MTIKEKNVGFILCFNICLSLIPFILGHLFSGFHDSNLYLLTTIIVFMLQIISTFVYIIRKNPPTIRNNDFIISILIVGVILIITLLQLLFGGNNIKIMDVFSSGARIVTFLLYFVLLGSFRINKNQLISFNKFIIGVGLIASIYNIIINFSKIPAAIISNSPYDFNFMSFFLNRNTFAQLLMLSTMSLLFISRYIKRKKYYLCLIFFIINLLLTFSRTSIAVTIIFVLIYNFMISRNKTKTITNILIIFFIFIVLIIAISPLRTFFIEKILRVSFGTANRTTLWKIALSNLEVSGIYFGIGEYTAIEYIKELGFDNSQMHSLYIDILITGGILLMCLFIILIIYLTNIYKKIYKVDRESSIFMFVSLLSFLIYGIFESVTLFSIGYIATIFTVFIVVLPKLYYNEKKKIENQVI